MTSNLLFNLKEITIRFSYAVLVLLTTVQLVSANKGSGQKLDQMVAIQTNNTSLTELFLQLEKQTDYRFVYDKGIADDINGISLTEKSLTLEKVLNELMSTYGLKMKVVNQTIWVSKNNEHDFWKEKDLPQNETEIKGKIIDANTGEPLIGASVGVKGTTKGTTTNANGEFSLMIGEGDETIIISYVGYQTIELPVTADFTNISMQAASTGLDEVVVIGYGTNTKEKFNGAVSKVEGKSINEFSSANFEQAVVGKVSGVQVFTNGKNPGDNSVIQIRGLNSLSAGTNPLILVDGNPLSEGSSMSSINTNDIESISILKGAASAAIYGSRASSGVIFITTKKGKGALNVTYDGYIGSQNRIDKFELTDAYETALFDYDARNYGYISGGEGRSINDDNDTRDANGGGKRSRIPNYLQDYVDGKPGLTNTDWTDAVFRTAMQQSHYINLNGGTGKSNYSISFGLLDQENIIVDSDYKRYSNNIRFNTQLSEKITFGINTNISMTDANLTGERGWSSTRLGFRQQADPAYSVVLMQPYYPIYNTDGSYAIANQINDNNDNWDGPISENTLAQTFLTDYLRHSFRAFGSSYLEIKLIEGLKFKTLLGGDFDASNEEYFGPSTIGDYRTPVANNRTKASRAELNRRNFITENTLNYNKTFNKHTFDALAGYSYQEELFTNVYMQSEDFADDNIRNLGGATTIASSFSSYKWALESFFSRLQYDFDNRYSLSASLRRDGSSRFGANTKYGNFSSLSGGWTLSNESFFPKNDVLTFTKLRISWGQTGNNQIGNYSSIATLNDDNYTVDGTLVSGLYINSAPNADLSWETNTALNFGLDLGFLNNKMQFTAEYYKTNTTDMLLSVPVPQQSGFSSSLQNIGELENRGFELELSGRDFKVGDFVFGFNANIAATRNKVVSLGEGQDQIIYNNQIDFITKVGSPIAQFYAYDILDVYRDQAQIDNDPVNPLAGTEVGDYVVRDANGDGEITPDDRVMLGDYNPDFTYGFGVSMSYKAFDLNAQFYGVQGREVVDNMVYRSESGEGFFVPTKYYFDNYYNDRNQDGFFRRPDFSSFSSAGRLTRSSSLSILDGDYLRLRSLQIGYTLPNTIAENLHVKGLRVYFTGNNIFQISEYRGFNSDGIDTRSTSRQVLGRGHIHTTSPLTRFMALGVNIKF